MELSSIPASRRTADSSNSEGRHRREAIHARREAATLMAGTRLGYLARVIRHGEPPYPRAKPAVLVHGTLNGYSYHACRCEECREAHRTHAREYREKPKTWPNCAHGR